SGTFTFTLSGKQTPAITYTSDPNALVAAIQAALDVSEGPGVVRATGSSLAKIDLELRGRFNGSPVYTIPLQTSGLTNVTILAGPESMGGASVNFYVDRCNWFSPQSFQGSLQVAMADGSVRNISPSVSPNSWTAAVTPNGGEVLGSDFDN